jgi:hypothetical protein
MRALDSLADEGTSRLVIQASPILAADITVLKSFVRLVAHAGDLGIAVSLVAPSAETHGALDAFVETSRLPRAATLADAVGSLA